MSVQELPIPMERSRSQMRRLKGRGPGSIGWSSLSEEPLVPNSAPVFAALACPVINLIGGIPKNGLIPAVAAQVTADVVSASFQFSYSAPGNPALEIHPATGCHSWKVVIR